MRLATAIAALLLTVAAPVGSQTIAITGATAIDGTGRPPISDAVILLRDGRISAIGSAAQVTIPTDATRIDARGKYVIPGLMDANLHLYLNGDLESLIKLEDRYHEVALEGAQIALKSGHDDGLRHLGAARRAHQGARHDQRRSGAGEPHLSRRQHHRLQRSARPRLPRGVGGAREQGLRQAHQRNVGTGDRA